MIGSLSLAAALLLAAAGVAKVAAPEPGVAMVHRAWPGVPSGAVSAMLLRIAGVAEVAVAVAVGVHGGRGPAALLAAAYAVFTVTAVRLLRRGPRTSCGCFGRTESPISRAHVVVDLAAVATAVAASVRPPGPLGGLASKDALPAAVGLAQSLLLAYLAFLAMTALPALAAERRRVAA